VASNGFILGVYDLDLTPLVERHVVLPIRIGRSALNDVTVPHQLVSEFHARVEHVDGRLCVRDLNSKNGVLVESLGSDGQQRVGAQAAVDLEPYGYEFLLSPLLRVRVRPASAGDALRPRRSLALGSVLGNGGVERVERVGSDRAGSNRAGGGAPGSVLPPSVLPPPTLPPLPWSASGPHGTSRGPIARVARADAGLALTPASASPAVQPYASVFVEPAAAPLDLPPLPRAAGAVPDVAARPTKATRVSQPSPPRAATLLEPAAHALPALAHTAWENGTWPAAGLDPAAPEHPPASLEALALRGLRELGASLLPGRAVESAGDVVQLITKLHDALEMFCRCFIPVREACSRFGTPEELERNASARCRGRSPAYLAVERALEPAALAAALLDWHEPAQDAPLAVEHILADLMLQQLGTLHAAVDGARALLDELSPATLDGQVPRTPSVLSRLGLAGARERLLWEALVQRHAQLASSSALESLFGEAFGRALSTARGGSNEPPP